MSRAQPSMFATAWSVAVSLAFWSSLLISATALAGVTLAPKLCQLQRLQEQYASNQHQLVQLERQTLQLQQVVTALEHEPAFAQELARVEFDAFRPGEEVLPVEADLRLDPRHAGVAVARAVRAEPVWQPALQVLATDRALRSGLLAAAAVLVIVAFTWLHDGSEPVPRSERPPAWYRQLWARYQR